MISNKIVIDRNTVLFQLSKIAIFLILASTIGQLIRIFTGHPNAFGLIPLFYVDQEVNLTTYFSMLLLLSASVLLMIITILEKKRATAFVSCWFVLAIGFFLMSIDEMISIHEALTWPIRRIFFGSHAGIFYSGWVIPGMALTVIIGIFLCKFILNLSAKTKRSFLLSAFIYLSGVIGMELIGGRYAEQNGASDMIYLLCTTTEESLEMFGIIIFIGSLLEYIADNFIEVQFQIEKN